MIPEVPLQHDMFSGELVDNRTAAQKKANAVFSLPQQMWMFKQRDVVQIGVKTPPVVDISNVSAGELVLVSEDIRTDEEKERDLQRQAEALTTAMFADQSEHSPVQVQPPMLAADPDSDENKEGCLPDSGEALKPKSLIDEPAVYESPGHPEEGVVSEDPQVLLSPRKTETSKLTAYLELVQAAQEQITTLWIDPAYQARFDNLMTATILSGKEAGLTPAEMNAAIAIGRQMGKQKQAASPIPSPLVLEKRNGSTPTVVYETQKDNRLRTPAREGYRRRARRTQIGVRTRSPQAA